MYRVVRDASSSGPIRIGAAGSSVLFRDLFCECLSRLRQFTVVWTAAETPEALKRLDEMVPDVLLIDLELSRGNPFDLGKAALTRPENVRIVFLSERPCPASVGQALSVGAAGFFTKATPWEAVVEMLEHVAAGRFCLSSDVQQQVRYDPRTGKHRLVANGSLARLTPRQLEVLTHLAHGDSVKQVARKLHLTEKAVDSHKYRIMRALDIHDRVHLARFAIREGLMQP